MPQISPSKYLVTAGWSDVPHLSERTKAELLAATPVYLRKARSEGIPALGSGAIFPVAEELITCDPIPIPGHWKQIIGMDFGWDHPTAAAHLAYDPEADVVYVTKNYKRSEATPIIHAAAIKPWGQWTPIAWPHDALQHDKGAGIELSKQYQQQELNMLDEMATWPEDPEHNDRSRTSVEAGLADMLARMETGRWKVFKSCQDWLAEYRLYHRKDGRIIKEFDDAISASRYAYMMLRYARSFIEAHPARSARRAPPNWRTA